MSSWDPAGKVDVMDALEVLEVDNLRREGMREARFSCPFPGHENGDKSASAYMNLETCQWFCHGCKRKGSIVRFVAAMYDMSPMKARRLLRQAYDPASLNPDERDIREEVLKLFAREGKTMLPIPQNTRIGEDKLDYFAVKWKSAADAQAIGDGFPACDYMLDRGFSWQTLEAWDFGYDEATQRITIPVRDDEGHLVGFKARATDGRHPKYLVLGEGRYGFPRYYTGQVVFGLDRVPVEYNHVVICEGELNAIALHQMGHDNSVALNGSNLTSHQANLIRRRFGSATFYFDPDKAGDRGLWGWDDEETGEHHLGALERLAVDLDVLIVPTHDADPADMLEQARDSEVYDILVHARSYSTVAVERRLASTP